MLNRSKRPYRTFSNGKEDEEGMLLMARTAAALSCFVTVILSTLFLKRNWRPTYFKCAFYGLLPLCLSGFYSLAATGTNSDGFSLCVLGEASAYIFVNAANRSLIPREEAEQRRHISVPGLLAAGVLLVILLVPLWLQFRLSVLFTAVIYAFAMCPCLYSCVDVCHNPYDNPFKNDIRGFNRMVILHIAATALLPAALAGLSGAAETVCVLFCGLAWTVADFEGMLLLKKGLEPWEI